MAASSDERVQEVPGSYGLPIIGAIADRFDYFVKEGTESFFKKRIEKYKSTVFRVNMPPGPPLFPDPRVIILLDAKSFPILFDVSKVEKKNVFTGVYMPSTDFTGGYRVLSYLDPSEENHTKLKKFCFHVLKTNATKWFPEFDRTTRGLLHSKNLLSMAKAVEGSSGWKLGYFVVAIISVVVVGMSGRVEGAISCSTVVSDVIPCLSYVAGSAAQPTQGCCTGIKSLNSAATTTADRQAVCNCIKSAASSYQANYDRIGKLPAACGVNLGFAITPSLNCATIR